MVHVRTGLNQQLQGLDTSLMRGVEQRSPTLGVRDVQVSV